MRVPVRFVALGLGAVLIGGLAACGGAATPANSGSSAAPTKPAAATEAKPAAKAGDASAGKTLFSQSCVACHGAEGKGVPGLGKDMTTSTFIKGLTEAQLVDFLKKGRPVSDPANTTKVDMPPKGGNPALTDAQLGDLAAFVKSINK